MAVKAVAVQAAAVSVKVARLLNGRGSVSSAPLEQMARAESAQILATLLFSL
ncbi:hypothetical protein [Paenibacillus sp. PK3_47]|uniref:hypothetical protein n=1 Tax=Paenibacillus sp. PK3_47 TaxID=2072642 RepID=UPI00201D4A0B|nr:hypothetical protein [Paenibacillus sp. PK3_47]